jgi:tRNA pseudouridine13 synthase
MEASVARRSDGNTGLVTEAPLPYLTAGLPGIGGILRARPEDFVVEELPAYPAAGEGAHVFVWIEKRGITTDAAAAALARAAGVEPRDVGWAGMKDRHAVTRQWLSLPPPVTPERAAALAVAGVTVLAAVRHPHKLRTGHLRGNRFVLTVRDARPGAADLARAVVAELSARGVPNFYGEQRFGAAGDNAARGAELLRGGGGRVPPKLRRLLISALQSSLFNSWLRARVDDGLFGEVIEGDLTDRRGVVTGPMFGPEMRAPAPGTLAAAREATVLEAAGLTVEDFARAGKLAEGTRRPLAIELGDVSVTEIDATTVTIGFTLPAGAYATVVMREVMK